MSDLWTTSKVYDEKMDRLLLRSMCKEIQRYSVIQIQSQMNWKYTSKEEYLQPNQKEKDEISCLVFKKEDF